MSFKNIHYDKSKGIMYIWDESVTDNNHPKEVQWIPHCYTKVTESTGWKSIFGENVVKKEFKSFWDYKNFCDVAFEKSRKNPKIRQVFENNVKSEIQYLVDQYYQIPDDDMITPKLRIMAFDIEVDTVRFDRVKQIKCRVNGKEDFYNLPQIEKITDPIEMYDEKIEEWVPYHESIFLSTYGFPEPMLAERPICMITVWDSVINKTFTFGLKSYTGEDNKEPWLKYIQCRDEEDLINRFLTFIEKTRPDVITGWNCYKFDIAYIINRIRKLHPGVDPKAKPGSTTLMDQTSPEARRQINRLSPIGVVHYWSSAKISDVTQEIEARMDCDIAGVSILDYMDLYKQYSNSRLPSHRLDFVANYELNKGKLEYSEYRNLAELYYYNFNKYKEYNVIDVKRVKQLIEKLGYIELVQSLSLLSKCPMKFYGAVTHIVEGAFLTYLRRNGKVAPLTVFGEKIPYEAAYVKEPIPGLYGWNADLDITSSYPTAMILLNMGLETYVGNIISFMTDEGIETLTEEKCVEYVRARKFPRFTLKDQYGELSSLSQESLDTFNKGVESGLFAISPDGCIFRTDVEGSIAGFERYLFNKRVEVRVIEKELGKQRDKFNKDSSEWEELDIKRTQKRGLQTAIKTALNAAYGALAVPYFRYFNQNIPKAICACGRWSVKQGEVLVDEICNDYTKSPELVAILDELRDA